MARRAACLIDRKATIMTDSWPAYRHLDDLYTRESVDYSKEEYARAGGIHVNSIEGFWSLLKRQIYGIHHWVSAKHLHRYVSESVWRFKRRIVDDPVRLDELLARADGRLTYKALIAKP